MNLRANKLIGLPVYTESRQHLGKVADFELDPLGQSILRYYVRGTDLLKELLGGTNELIISREQIVLLTTEQMIVEDAVTTAGNKKKERIKKPLPA